MQLLLQAVASTAKIVVNRTSGPLRARFFIFAHPATKNAAITMAPFLYAEYLVADLLLDLPHRQFVFTILKYQIVD